MAASTGSFALTGLEGHHLRSKASSPALLRLKDAPSNAVDLHRNKLRSVFSRRGGLRSDDVPTLRSPKWLRRLHR